MVKSDRENAGLRGPVRHVRMGGRSLSNDAAAVAEDEWIDGFSVYDEGGRLLEDASAERSLIEQEPYRSVYAYNERGLVAEVRTFNQDGSADGVSRYDYDSGGRLTEHTLTSAQGHGSSRTAYDAKGNVKEILWFEPDGTLRGRQVWHYTYKEDGNKLEEYYFTEEEAPTSSPESAALWTAYAPYGFHGGETSYDDSTLRRKTPTHKRVITHDEAGRRIEVARHFYDRLGIVERYDAEGQLIEKLGHFDERGEPQEHEVRAYDAEGRLISIHHQVTVPLPMSNRPFKRRYSFAYDERGNLKEFAGYEEDGSLYSRESYGYEYDQHGNWVKSTKTWVTKDGHESVTVDFREITYF
jgi:YD repeat-containing protein